MLALRALIGFAVMAFLMYLTWRQIPAAQADGYLTVEQATKRGIKALTWDRHYAMVVDFCIIPGTALLAIVLCAKQWELFGTSSIVTALVTVAVILFCLFVLWIGGTEAHVHDRWPTTAGFLHAVYAAIAAWIIAMVLVNTPRPEPVLLLILCIVVPAFFFVGTHKFLGMINFDEAASTYSDKPLQDVVGWVIIVLITGLVWWRAWTLIPSSFWQSLN